MCWGNGNETFFLSPFLKKEKKKLPILRYSHDYFAVLFLLPFFVLHLHKDFSFFFSRNATERIGNPFLEGKRTDLLFNSVKGPILTHTPKKAEKEFRLSPSSFITYKQSAIIYTNDGLIVNIGHTLHRLQTNLQSTRVLPVELHNNKKQTENGESPSNQECYWNSCSLLSLEFVTFAATFLH